jgi:hypothetical protein
VVRACLKSDAARFGGWSSLAGPLELASAKATSRRWRWQGWDVRPSEKTRFEPNVKREGQEDPDELRSIDAATLDTTWGWSG